MTKTIASKHSTNSFGKNIMKKLSRIGGVLLFPIAVLPIAAILLRIGADIPGTTAFSAFVGKWILGAGDAVFANMPMIFAIGVAFGFTKENRGEAAFAGFVGMYVLYNLLGSTIDLIYGSINFGIEGATGFRSIFGSKFDAAMVQNVLNGIIVGSIISWIYNRANGVALPKVLGFFSGKRLIPALAIIVVSLFVFVWGLIFPWIGYLIYIVSVGLQKAANQDSNLAKAGIMGVYGFINRLLIPFGLHHIPNNLFWFQLGEWVDGGGNAIHGDIFIFLNGVPKNNPGGIFQAGFFPTMMFGLPALVLVFALTAENKVQRSKVFALYGSAALISFISGITEPIEYAFMYVSPLIYLIHAILTGVFAFITGVFGIQLGFGFSAGFMDYLLSFNKSLAIIRESGFTGAKAILAHPLWIFPIGAVCGATYFFGGMVLVKKLNLSTPGRGNGIILEETESTKEENLTQLSTRAKKIVKAYGGWENISEYNNCSTRLRYVVKDGAKVDLEALKKSGVMGVARISDTSIQTIIGVEAEALNNEIVSHKGESLE
ncbi:PTS transporter subunit EIIC [Mycoplasmopsis anatis]|uniref:PTS transporter subunit EIIC n=1 Tax=Mycoplasmopsis anatis TaxID=171279 RepID=UPI001C4F7BC2|nr:PTS transporter subunit EIIC [Mycoplasmopsis anatis]MBW0597019.1 PTS glucose transporter subunit IIABC [Mycoplasmopsis anatis]MBW0597199.1 PTS glucose transporter subunit IIABC [Mycoplasmopsis anatis]MBW0599605.1 PTS glucose transporter subunit IIABC [Mycoplasmopsis anatis]